MSETPQELSLPAEGPMAGSPDSLATRFDLLSDETRLRIIEALFRGIDREERERLGFSELCSRTGTADTGQFNYHLNRLRGSFVEKTADGYRLTAAGEAIGRMLVADGTDPD